MPSAIRSMNHWLTTYLARSNASSGLISVPSLFLTGQLSEMTCSAGPKQAMNVS
jgi:hypothetical protein